MLEVFQQEPGGRATKPGLKEKTTEGEGILAARECQRNNEEGNWLRMAYKLRSREGVGESDAAVKAREEKN